MVIWMSTNDKDTNRIDEFLHFYRLRRSKDPTIRSLNHGVGVNDWFLISHRFFETRKPTSSLSLATVGNSLWERTQMILPNYFIVGVLYVWCVFLFILHVCV